MLNFSEENLNMYLHLIPPHWHAINSWNPFWYKTRTCLFYIVNIMVADAVAMQGARVSAAMILT